MSKHKKHSDEEPLRRIRHEVPELLTAESDFDEAFKALIRVDPDRIGLTNKRKHNKKHQRTRKANHPK